MLTGSSEEGVTVFLSPHVYPEPISTGRYNTSLLEGLRDAGLKPLLVLSSEPIYPAWIPTKCTQSLPNIKIVRGGGWVRYPRNPILRRMVLELWYVLFLIRKLPRARKSARLVVAVMPPVLYLLVSRIFFRAEVGVVGIVHDLQSVFVEKSESKVRRFVLSAVRFFEKQALQACDKLIFLSESMASKAINAHGLDARKCSVSLPFVTVSVRTESAKLADVLKPNFVHVVYSGALGDKQNPNRLLECFVHVTDSRPDVIFHCFSAGPVFERLKAGYREKPGIEFHGLVEENSVPELMARSHIQVVPQLFGTSEGALPSKLPNLIAAGVPVLAICDEQSELGKLVVAADAGKVVHSWDPSVVSTAVLALLEETKGQSREDRRRKASEFVQRNFNLDRLVSEIVDFANGTSRTKMP